MSKSFLKGRKRLSERIGVFSRYFSILLILIGEMFFSLSCQTKEKKIALQFRKELSFIFELDTSASLTEIYPRYFKQDSTLIWTDRSEQLLYFYQFTGKVFRFIRKLHLPGAGQIYDVYYHKRDSIFVHYNTSEPGERLKLYTGEGKLIRKIETDIQLAKFGGVRYGSIIAPAVKLEADYCYHPLNYADKKIYAYFFNELNVLNRRQSIFGCIDLNNRDSITWMPVYFPPEAFRTNDPLLFDRSWRYFAHTHLVGNDTILVGRSHTCRIDLYDRKSIKQMAVVFPRSDSVKFINDTINMRANPSLDINQAIAVSGSYQYLYFDSFRNVFYRLVYGPCTYRPKDKKQPIVHDSKTVVQILNRQLELMGEHEFKGGKLFISPAGMHALDYEATQKANLGNKGKQKFIFSTYQLSEKYKQ